MHGADDVGLADTRAGHLSLFFHRVRDFVTRAPVTCRPDVSAVGVARLLSRAGVGSVVVVAGDGAPAGIVTDRDLRNKVVAPGRDATATTAGDIMSAPLVAIGPAVFAFEALLEMTRRQIHHLVVTDEGRLIGVVSTNDFLPLHTTHPVALAREITRAASVEVLKTLAGRVTALVRRLVEEGGSAYDIGQIVAELNDRVVVRVLDLAAGRVAEAGGQAPPVLYAWLALGSEARREQTLRTDQDNGLVYADPPPELAERAAAYYQRLAAAVIGDLVAVGFPPCDGGFMASNPRWCQPFSTWAGYFRRWMAEPAPQPVLDACIFFDLRPVGGQTGLGAALADVIRTEAPSHRTFLAVLARDVATRHMPLTLFGNVAVPRRGEHRGRVDVKSAGSFQLVGAARLHALELGLVETNTIERLRAAGERGLYRDEEVREITDAYQHLLRLRLVHQLERLAAGQRPDNWVEPRRLSHADGLLFRDALKTVTRVQAGIRERFATDFVAGL